MQNIRAMLKTAFPDYDDYFRQINPFIFERSDKQVQYNRNDPVIVNKILALENQIATVNYTNQFLHHCNAYEHLRRALSFYSDENLVRPDDDTNLCFKNVYSD